MTRPTEMMTNDDVVVKLYSFDSMRIEKGNCSNTTLNIFTGAADIRHTSGDGSHHIPRL